MRTPEAQVSASQRIYDAGYNLINTIHGTYEALKDKPALCAALGALVAFGSYELCNETESGFAIAADPTIGKIVRSDKLSTQAVLNEIHQIIPSGDWSPNPKKFKILPTSAFLEPSSGGFKTDCSNPYVSTFRDYSISTYGQNFHTCGPQFVHEKKTSPGQFQASLNSLGGKIQNSVKLSNNESTIRIGGTRRKVTAIYNCAVEQAGNMNSTGVKQILLERKYKLANHKRRQYTKAIISFC